MHELTLGVLAGLGCGLNWAVTSLLVRTLLTRREAPLVRSTESIDSSHSWVSSGSMSSKRLKSHTWPLNANL